MTERRFPIMGKRVGEHLASIPWSVIAPHEAQANANHGQTLDRLAQRGGLSPCEAVAVIEGRAWREMLWDAAVARLHELTKPELSAVGADPAVIAEAERLLKDITPGEWSPARGRGRRGDRPHHG